MLPQSIQLYWLTSATLGLLQTWSLDWWDHRRRLARQARRTAALEVGQNKPESYSPIVVKKVPKPKIAPKTRTTAKGVVSPSPCSVLNDYNKWSE